MSDRIIPIIDQRTINSPRAATLALPPNVEAKGILLDTLQRPLHDLRISVTDRCNFRCGYCMPRALFGKDHTFLPHQSLLTFEEIARTAVLFAAHGVTKIRLTGGEPLLRKDLHKLVVLLRDIKTPSGDPLELTLTTNGALLAKKAYELKQAGLDRVTVSLDALDDSIFKRMNDADFSVAEVLHGLDVAHQVGLGPIKINMVVKAGVNNHQVLPMARHFKGTPFILRFIEYMDVGNSNDWKMEEVIPSSTIIEQISNASNDMRLVAAEASIRGATAQRWKYADGTGELGVISSVTAAFCQDCTRLRLSTDGKLYTCLFATQGHDLKHMLRTNASDEQLSNKIAQIWHNRGDRYSDLRHLNTLTHADLSANTGKIEMSYIGG